MSDFEVNSLQSRHKIYPVKSVWWIPWIVKTFRMALHIGVNAYHPWKTVHLLIPLGNCNTKNIPSVVATSLLMLVLIQSNHFCLKNSWTIKNLKSGAHIFFLKFHFCNCIYFFRQINVFSKDTFSSGINKAYNEQLQLS